MSQGLMQLLPSNFLKNFTLLGNIIRECGEDSEAWFPGIMHDLMYIAGCISGEAGELVNEVKKVRRGTYTLDEQRTKIEEESIDVFIFLATLWAELGTNVTEIYNAKRARNAERFGSGRVGTDRTSPAGE
jgi:NTP pyrophosphatase (non-canonical NTP hydrolase)